MWTIVLLLLHLLCLVSTSTADDLEWAREIHSVSDFEVITIDPSKVLSLSWTPRVFLYKNFLTSGESDHLINLARDHLETSSVVDPNGEQVLSLIRTSSGMFVNKAQDDIVKRIEDKIGSWTLLPLENGEQIQVLRYEYGQKYEPHHEFFTDKLSLYPGGHRVATVLMYLSDVIKGGETVFPLIQDKTTIKDNSWSECAKRGLAVKPSKGDALLFYNLHPNGSLDETSLHQRCPIIDGVKWSATKWIRASSFDRHPQWLATTCVDENAMCGKWAATGECRKNPNYMLDNKHQPGLCRKSCHAC